MQRRSCSVLFIVTAMMLLIHSSGADAIAIGVAPGILNAGDAYPGTSKLVEFFLITTSPEDMMVSLSPIDPHFDFFMKEHRGAYTFIPEESSNERVNSWISFPENPVLVSPGNVITHTFPGGEKIRANKKVRAILNIPKDADPGYHVGSINFAPKLANENSGGVATLAVSRFLYVFYVKPLEGQPEPFRDGKIMDIEAHRDTNGRVRVDVLFQNTGTDTVLAKITDLEIYDNFGELQHTAKSGYAYVKPKETRVLSGFWNTDDAEGTHLVKTNVDFLTGAVTSETEVIIPELATEPIPVFIPTAESGGFPWWIVIVLIVIFLIVMYFKSEWMWLLVIIALLIAFLIVMGLLLAPPDVDLLNIPWWIIIIIIAVIALIVYWRI